MLYDNLVKLSVLDRRPKIVERPMPTDMQKLIEGRVGMGFWQLAPLGRVVTISGQTARIMNLPSWSDELSLNEFVGCFVPADSKRLAKAMDDIADKMAGFEAVLRLYFKGEIKVVEMFGDVVTDANGGLVNIIGTVRDISQRISKEATSKGRAAIMRVVMKHIPCAVAVLDNQMRFLSVSDHWIAGHGLKSADDLLGKVIYDVFPQSNAFRHEHKKVLDGEIVRSHRDTLLNSIGGTIGQTVVICPWRTAQGRVGGAIIMLGQVDEKMIENGNLPEPHEHQQLLELLDAL